MIVMRRIDIITEANMALAGTPVEIKPTEDHYTYSVSCAVSCPHDQSPTMAMAIIRAISSHRGLRITSGADAMAGGSVETSALATLVTGGSIEVSAIPSWVWADERSLSDEVTTADLCAVTGLSSARMRACLRSWRMGGLIDSIGFAEYGRRIYRRDDVLRLARDMPGSGNRLRGDERRQAYGVG